ncbi:MAG: adenylate kinase [Abditibacteriota bacterium]|nr:adenylate kinase [Abditibacteriota bacterium]MBP5737911.1 adenylate kinase [Abditibacteriota bacterium]
MRIVLFGPPGSGKGTQAAKITFLYKAEHISTGDALRQAVAKGEGLGAELKRHLEKGELAPDELVIGIVAEKLAEIGYENYILDGFPRTVEQAQALDKILSEAGKPLETVVDFEVSLDALESRICSRRVCPACNEVYNINAKPPKKEGVCDKCGAELIQRADDNRESLKKRLEAYEGLTKPVLLYYNSTSASVVKVDASGSADEVFAELRKKLGL